MAPYKKTGRDRERSSRQGSLHERRPGHLPKAPENVRSCCSVTSFFLMTCLLVADIATDILTIGIFIQRKDTLYYGLGLMFLILNGAFCAVTYALSVTFESSNARCAIAGCLVTNFPLQLGIVFHRFGLFGTKCNKCLEKKESKLKADWALSHLKLIQSMLESAPMLLLNTIHIIVKRHPNPMQYVSILVSLASLVCSTSLYEKARKERSKGRVSYPEASCIFVYKGLVLTARMLAMANFASFFGLWILGIIAPHFLLILIFYVYRYHEIWKVHYHTIVTHALYCLFAYFPVHNEYRPEGEIMIYYALYMIENVIMITMPYTGRQPQLLDEVVRPGSPYYLGATLTVLVGSALGLCFMAVYYFLLHKSKGNIRDEHFGCLSNICLWAKKKTSTDQSHEDHRLHIPENEDIPGPPTVDENMMHRNTEVLTTEYAESEPPSYRTYSDASGYKPSIADTDFDVDSDGKTGFTETDLDSPRTPSREFTDDDTDPFVGEQALHTIV